ncbi:MAG: cysteine desulfurase family protein [Deltaproteobacteria bacterium]|jgi:cysteine desulfurase|nr:cysteine desulfurase family protein [Deltaproteobacteria bacterium]
MNNSCYLDCASSTRVLPEVSHTYITALSDYFPNPSAVHAEGKKSFNFLNEQKEKISEILKIKPEQVIITSGATESNNTVFHQIKNYYKPEDGRVLISQIEHGSVFNPAQDLAELGYDVRFIRVNKEGTVDLEHFASQLEEPVIFVSTMLVNNETGIIQPVDKMVEMAKNKYPNLLFHCDAVQGVYPKIWHCLGNVDFFSLSGHKFHSPKGIGILVHPESYKIKPLLLGGGQQDNRRSGTMKPALTAAFTKALEISWQQRRNKIEKLNQAFLEIFAQSLPQINIKGKTQNRIPWTLNIGFPGITGSTLRRALARENIFVSQSSACSSQNEKMSRILQAMGANSQWGHIRISFSYLHEEKELTAAAHKIIECYRKYSLVKTSTDQ